MEKLHLPLLKGVNWILAGLLMILGFACSDDADDIMVEYGTPHASYQVKGKVVDAKGIPIPDIRVRVYSDDDFRSWLRQDTVYTNSDGEFEWKQTTFPCREFTFISEETETDMSLKRLQSDTTRLSFNANEFVGGDHWFEGTASKEFCVVLRDYADPHTEPYRMYTIYGTVTDQKGYPLPGIVILTDPVYTPNQYDDLGSFPSITDYNGHYRFTYDRAPASAHTIYTDVYRGYWNDSYSFGKDSVVVDFSEIELSGGKGMLIGKGSKEVNFELKRNS